MFYIYLQNVSSYAYYISVNKINNAEMHLDVIEMHIKFLRCWVELISFLEDTKKSNNPMSDIMRGCV